MDPELYEMLAAPGEEDAGFDDFGEVGDAADELEAGDDPDEEDLDEADEAEDDDEPSDVEGDPADAASRLTKPDASVTPPADLNAEEIAQFAKLTPDAQRFVASFAQRAQSSRTKTAHELSDLQRRIAPITQVEQQYGRHLQAAGMTSGQLLEGLTPYYVNLRFGNDGQKRQAIEELVKQFGVNLGHEGDENGFEENNRLKAFEDGLRRMQAQFQQVQGAIQSQKQSEVESEITAFQNTKDAKGSPAHPYFDKVAALMGQMISSGMAGSLKDAYDKAVLLDPDIQKEIAAKTSVSKRKIDEKIVRDAKNATSLNRKGQARKVTRKAPKTIRSAAEEAFEELSNR